MNTNFNQLIPEGMPDFLLVLVFSLLIGLSQRRLNLNREKTIFGSDRTFTFIGLLGYLLYIFKPSDMSLFAGGGLVIALFLGINYFFKIRALEDYGLTAIITALITYCMGPLVKLTPSWFYVSVVVVVLLLSEMKTTFVELAHKMNNDEFITLAKFLLIAFIILPMLPDERIISEISLTPYRIWLATVIVSAISYTSYILRKYVFPKSGVIVSGLIGGLYSSTATITILSRKCRTAPEKLLPEYISAMFIAVGMMFLRLLIVIAIFNSQVFSKLLIPMVVLMIISIAVGIIIFVKFKHSERADIEEEMSSTSDNPLEFKIALIFAFLFVLFTILTYYTIEYVGKSGVSLLSVLSGLGDITPFILNLIQGNSASIDLNLIASSCLLATMSNNIVKMFYAIGFSKKRKQLIKPLATGFTIVSVVNLIIVILFI